LGPAADVREIEWGYEDVHGCGSSEEFMPGQLKWAGNMENHGFRRRDAKSLRDEGIFTMLDWQTSEYGWIAFKVWVGRVIV
jgi:hypothetical protein